MLEVLLRTARASSACWVGEFDVVATATDVLTEFCRTYHLDRQSCALYYVQGGELPTKQLLRKIRKPQAHKFIQLTVEVREPTLSFLLGSKWLNIDAPNTSDRQALAVVWYSIAMAHSTAASYAATAMSDLDTLSQLVQCNHRDILPASVAQHTLKAAALETAPAASQPLVLLIHALGTIAASRKLQAATFPGLRNLQRDAEMEHLALQSLQHEPSKGHAAKLDQSPVTALMRCAILLLKLADLTPARAAEDATGVLWTTIAHVLTGFWDHMYTDSATDVASDQPPGIASEQQQLIRVLVQLLLHMLRHSPGLWQTLRSGAMTCFQLLNCLVTKPATQSTAVPAMCTQDGMMLIAKGLLQAKLHAKVASHLIFAILSADLTIKSRDATLKVIAEMQGVRRLSNLLCPTLDNTLEYDIGCARLVYKSKSVIYKTPADTDPHLEALHLTALMIGALLYAHPYSSQSPALQGCLPDMLAALGPGCTATPPGIQIFLDNPHQCQHNHTTAEQQQQLGQPEGPAEVTAGLVDQQNGCATQEPHLPGGPQLFGGPHPPSDPSPHGGPHQQRPDPALLEATSGYGGQHAAQTSGSSGKEAPSSVDQKQCANSTGAGFVESTVLGADISCATPSESVWSDIETVASRALVTLHWAIQGSTEVMQLLTRILHALVVGHVMDPALDMSKVLRFGLTAVLSALSQTESHPLDTLTTTCLRHLACLFLRRVTVDRHAFSALYGRCTHKTVDGDILIGRVRSSLAVEALWSLLGACDATAESAAYPCLLPEYVQAAYLLPQQADPADRVTTNEESSSSRKLPTSSELAGSLRFFYEAMLPLQPLHTALTSCACLLRLWAHGTADPHSAAVPSSTARGSIAHDVCDCLQAGLQAAVGLVTPVEGQEGLGLFTLQKLGLARALYQAQAALPQLFQEQPQRTVALVQLAIELVRVGHLHTQGHELQEQLLRACLLFLAEAQHVRPECTQGPLNLTDAMAEATTYWSEVCTGQDLTPSGYSDAGLTECQLDSMCGDLVLGVLEQRAETEMELDWSLQTAVMSSMCWLRTASYSGFDGFRQEMGSYRYKGLVRCLSMIPMYTALGQLAVEVPGWAHDAPSQTSHALLRLLCIHVIHLSMAAEVVPKSGSGPREVAPASSKTVASGLRSLASAGKAATLSSDPQLQQSSGVAAYAQSLIEQLLEGLKIIRDHSVWDQAPAAMEDISWLPQYISLAEFLKTLKVVAANRILDNKILQQLQQAFLGPTNATRAGTQQPQFAMMTPDSVTHEDAEWEAREAAAQKAAQQLLAEEDEKATKAAAKQAKKLRQKLKKQQQAKGSQLRAGAQDLAADVEVSLQDSSAPADLKQSVDTSLGQPSATEDQRPQSVTTQHSAVPHSGRASSVNAQTEHAVAPAVACPLLSSDPLSSSHQDSVHAELSGGSASHGPLHKLLCCPLTKVMMVDPVIAADGHTYERAALQDWLQHSAISPVDKTPLKHTRLVTNLAIKNVVAVQGQQV